VGSRGRSGMGRIINVKNIIIQLINPIGRLPMSRMGIGYDDVDDIDSMKMLDGKTERWKDDELRTYQQPWKFAFRRHQGLVPPVVEKVSEAQRIGSW